MVELLYNDAQFYLLFNFLLWVFVFYLGYKRVVPALMRLQFVIMIPMFYHLVHSSYMQGIVFGYGIASLKVIFHLMDIHIFLPQMECI